jgi:hypothetical protein
MLQKLLMLIESFDGLLLEDKVDFISAKQGDKVWAAYEQDPTPNKPKFTNASEVIKYLADNISEKHLQKIVNWYQQSQILLGDIGNIKTLIDAFEKVKPKLEKKDLNQYKDVDDLRVVMDVEEPVSNKQKERDYVKALYDKNEIETFYKDSSITVSIPKTEEASKFLGRGTKWCTAADKDNMFDNYNSKGKLYVIDCKNGEKYQFYFAKKISENEYRDAGDESINLFELVNKYPSLIKAFSIVAFDANVIELMKGEDIPHLTDKKKVDIFNNNPHVNDFDLSSDLLYWASINMGKLGVYGYHLSKTIGDFLTQRIDNNSGWERVIDSPIILNGFEPDGLLDHVILPLLRDFNDKNEFIETLFNGGEDNPVLTIIKKSKTTHKELLQVIIEVIAEDFNRKEIKICVDEIKKDKESFDIFLNIIKTNSDLPEEFLSTLESLGVI